MYKSIRLSTVKYSEQQPIVKEMEETNASFIKHQEEMNGNDGYNNRGSISTDVAG